MSNILNLVVNRCKNMDYKKTKIVLIIASTLFFFLFLFTAHLTRSYTSDDVSIQGILQSWQDGHPLLGVAGADNFIIKVPLYLFVELFVPNSRLQLFIIALVCNFVLLACIVVFLLYYLRRFGLQKPLYLFFAFIPVIAFLSLSPVDLFGGSLTSANFTTSFMNPNYRNTEIGIMLLLVIAFVQLLDKGRMVVAGRRIPALLAGTLLTALLSLFFYNDPFFVYVFGGGMFITLTISWLVHRISSRRYMSLVSIVGVAYAGSIVLHELFAKLGFTTADNFSKKFINSGDIFSNIEVTIGSLFRNYKADFLGHTIGGWVAVLVLNSLLLILSVAAVVYAIRKTVHKFDHARLALIATLLMACVVFCVSVNGSSFTNYRYLFIVPFCSLPLIGAMLIDLWQHKPYRRLVGGLVGLLIVIVVINSGASIFAVFSSRTGHGLNPNSGTYQLIDTANKYHLTKGYTPYWDANIARYLSDRSLNALPIACWGGKVVQFHWLVNLPDYSIKNKRSFIVEDKNDVTHVSNCDIRSQFGVPAKTVIINSTLTLYIYNRDVGESLSYYLPGKKR